MLFYCFSTIVIIFADVTARFLLAQGHVKATLRDHVFKTVTVYDVTECGLLCSRDLRCKSFKGIQSALWLR